jgi:DNA primase
MSVLFDAVRGVSCIAAAEKLGWPLRRHGNRAWARCPFHGERTASLCLYDGDRGFYCYGCHAGGDAVGLYAKALNLSPLDAARQLAADFGIAATNDLPVQPRAPTVQDIRYALSQRRNTRYNSLVRVSRTCLELLMRLAAAAKTIEQCDRLWDNARFLQALRARTRAEDELDRLETVTLHELADYFREVDRDASRGRSERASENAG